LAGFDGGQQGVGDAVEAAGDADTLRARIVGLAGDLPDVRCRGLTQRPVALKRQVGVRGVVVDGVPGDFPRDRWWREVGVEVLQAQQPRIVRGVSRIPDLVHPDAGNVTQPRDRHR